MEIYKVIKKIREGKNFSQEYVAGELNLSQSQYCRRENGKIKFSVDQIDKLSKLFDVNVSLFFNNDNKNPSLGKRDPLNPKALIELYEACLREKDEIIALLKQSKKME